MLDNYPIFKSKRFGSAIVYILVMILVVLVPAVESEQDLIIKAVTALFGVLIGGYALQDTAAAMTTSAAAWKGVQEDRIDSRS